MLLDEIRISIHAPHAGCYTFHPFTFQPLRYFDPRTPCGVRLIDTLTRNNGYGISIHAPHAGCDGYCCKYVTKAQEFRSTHPMRGATIAPPLPTQQDKDFDPRTPCGVRPPIGVRCPCGQRDFDPRTPCGVRQIAPPERSIVTLFRSTHPMRGATS